MGFSLDELNAMGGNCMNQLDVRFIEGVSMTESKLFEASRPIKYASSFVVFYCDFAVVSSTSAAMRKLGPNNRRTVKEKLIHSRDLCTQSLDLPF